VKGDFLWNAGMLGGSTTISLFGTTTIDSGTGKILDRATLVNFGTLNWEQGRLHSFNAATFRNEQGGVVNVHTANHFDPAVLNAGEWIVDINGTGSPARFVSFENAGQLSLEAGKLAANSFKQTAGWTTLSGGMLASPSLIEFRGGELLGGGIIQGSLINSGARIVPGGDQVLHIQGNFTQTNNGILVVMLAGSGSAGEHDQVVVQGMANLDGTLQVRMLPPVSLVGERFPILVASSVTGTFDTVNVQSLLGMTVVADYKNKAVDLVVEPIRIVLPPKGDEPLPPGESPLPPVPSPTPGADPTPINNPGGINPGTPGGGNQPGNTSPPLGNVPIGNDDVDFPDLREIGFAPDRFISGAVGADVARALMLNTGVFGLLLTGSNRGAEMTQTSAESGGNTITGKLTGIASLASGEKAPTGRNTESSGLVDELFASFQLELPELELPSDKDLLGTGDILQSLIVGGRARADILPQAGSQLSVVATLFTSEDSSGRREGISTAADLASCFISPIGLGTGSMGTHPSRSVETVAMNDSPNDQEEDKRDPSNRILVPGAFLALVTFTGILFAVSRDERRRREHSPKL
jgi:hypothetical protein